MTRPIFNSEDIIDSRDVIDRIAELEATERDQEHEHGEFLDEDELDELNALRALRDAAQDYSDWQYGAALVRDSYFRTYAEELADDIGAIEKNAGWPLNHIDWEAAAEALKVDYTSVDFDGVTYWVRS